MKTLTLTDDQLNDLWALLHDQHVDLTGSLEFANDPEEVEELSADLERVNHLIWAVQKQL